MSIKAISWAFDQRCKTPSEKLVLIALADHANDQGECWPGQNYVAEKCDLSRERVCRFLGSLENQGLIASSRRKDASGRDVGKRYTLRMSPRPGDTAERRNSPPGVTNGHMAYGQLSQGCDQQSHANKVVEPSVEPSMNQKHGARENFKSQPTSLNPSEDHPHEQEKIAVLAEHTWQQFRKIMPERSGKFMDEDACRKKWASTPAMWGQWITAVRNYAASAEVRAGKTMNPMKFLSVRWCNWLTPEIPSGSGPPVSGPNLKWMKDLEEDERIVEQERQGGTKERVRPSWAQPQTTT